MKGTSKLISHTTTTTTTHTALRPAFGRQQAFNRSSRPQGRPSRFRLLPPGHQGQQDGITYLQRQRVRLALLVLRRLKDGAGCFGFYSTTFLQTHFCLRRSPDHGTVSVVIVVVIWVTPFDFGTYGIYRKTYKSKCEDIVEIWYCAQLQLPVTSIVAKNCQKRYYYFLWFCGFLLFDPQKTSKFKFDVIRPT